MRHNETNEIKALFGDAFGMDLHVVNAGDIFLSKLKGIKEPEEKENYWEYIYRSFFR